MNEEIQEAKTRRLQQYLEKAKAVGGYDRLPPTDQMHIDRLREETGIEDLP